MSSEPPTRNKGLLSRAPGARPRPGLEEEKLFPGCGRGRSGAGRRARRRATCGPSRPPARPGRPARALTSSMAATVFRHCVVRVVKLEAVGAL